MAHEIIAEVIAGLAEAGLESTSKDKKPGWGCLIIIIIIIVLLVAVYYMDK
jgi:hypothetical protein